MKKRHADQPTGISRRAFLKAGALFTAVGVFDVLSVFKKKALVSATSIKQTPKKPEVVVIGAGAFGGWTALHLLRKGARVTLVDAWGPGNSRASSGGDTRVIRAIYGPDQIYVKMVARSVQLWRENEKRWNQKLYTRTGALWMLQENDEFVRTSLPFLREYALKFDELSPMKARKRFPQINFEGVKWVFFEEEAGYIPARHACKVVLDVFVAEGGKYLQLSAKPDVIKHGTLHDIALSDGSTLGADHFVFACGSWLGKIFPNEIGDLIEPTRQSVYYFGTPPGDHRFVDENLPIWIDFGERILYGIPGDGRRGFKIADDTRGDPIDPTSDERKPSHEGFEIARKYLEFRFPALKGAPLLEARACVYENTPDHHFIIDRHPRARNLWLVGGGSGHGFKHGPALGEMVAEAVVAETPPNPFFSLTRFFLHEQN
ncbi:FAD-dependent oxidoreductase [candidate division KSB1 bacterium]|nr:FAD-dependent oxidoreductase [candidate division KSB1 bacterium]